jgi:hypothetical protein
MGRTKPPFRDPCRCCLTISTHFSIVVPNCRESGRGIITTGYVAIRKAVGQVDNLCVPLSQLELGCLSLLVVISQFCHRALACIPLLWVPSTECWCLLYSVALCPGFPPLSGGVCCTWLFCG